MVEGDRENCGSGISFSGCAQQANDSLSAGARAEAVLVWQARCLEGGSKVLGQRALHQATQHIPNHEGTHPAIGLAQGDDAADAQAGKNGRRDGSIGELLRGRVQKAGILLIIKEDAQMLIGHARRSGSRPAARPTEASDKALQRQRTCFAGLEGMDLGGQRRICLGWAPRGVPQLSESVVRARRQLMARRQGRALQQTVPRDGPGRPPGVLGPARQRRAAACSR